MEAKLKAVAAACKTESPKLCPGLSTQTALACLEENIAKLSPGCKSSVEDAAKSSLTLIK
jgi:hypothetical protein